jgi:large repetitive protein
MKKPSFFQSHTKILTDFKSRWTVIPILLMGMITNSFAQSPGGVTGASVWLKANAGTSTTTDGSTIATWNDQSGNSRTHTQPNGTVYQPLYKDNVFNFNPAVYFDGLDGMQASAFASGTDAVHVFAMSKVKDNGWRSIYGFGRDATHVQWYNGGGANKPSWWLSGNTYPSTALGINYGVTSFIVPKDGSQKTIHWNGTSANVAGSNTYTYNSTLMSVGTDISNGGAFSENFLGEIAEVIIYKKAGGGTMNTTDIQKIQSYLGIKYGVTLSHNYLDAGGATVYTLGTYNKNVFGIAHDNDQGLYQKQSKSYDANAYVTLSMGAVTTSNATNTGTLADKTFELIGDNGLDISYGVNYAPSTFTPTTAFYRMSRTWQVQETGTVGTVRITVPTGADRLLVSNSATFTPGAGTQELTFTADGNGGQYVDVDLNNTTNKFFTFGKSVGAPGCVAGGLNLWLKADAGATLSGGKVTDWINQTGGSLAVSQTNTAKQPTYLSNGLNFNPSLDFNGGNVLTNVTNANLIFTNTTNPATIYAVSTNRDAVNYWNNIINFDGDDDFPSPMLAWYGPSPNSYIFGISNPQNLHTANIPLNTPTAMFVRTANASPGAVRVSYNGITNQQTFSYADNTFIAGQSEFAVGAETNLLREPHDGLIPEILVYNRELSDIEIKRINSYMGIKYGITMTEEYLASNGTTVIWDKVANSTFHNNVFGIGREDCQDLNQKQSKSINTDGFVTIGNNAIIAATNAENTSAFSADKSFEIIGDNSLTNDYAVAYAPTTFTPSSPFFRMNRIWKVQETGTVGTVRISIPSSAERLLVSSSATFGSGTKEIALQSDGNGGFYADVDLENNEFFTFGTTITAPGCVTTNLQLWVKSDDSNGTAWNDNSPNANPVEKVGSIAPQAADATHNFHPYFNGFSATNHFHEANSSLNTSNSAVQVPTNLSVFAVVKPNAASSDGRITGIDNDVFFAAEPGFSLKNGSPYFYKFSDGVVSQSATAVAPAGRNAVVSWNFNNSTSNLAMGLNGSIENFSKSGSGIVGENLRIGYSSGWDLPGAFDGDIQEVIWYKSSLSATEVQKIQSYLAIKYGVTLAQNYLSGAGTTVYDVSTYGNNVFGIAYDKCQKLDQKQSKSGSAEGLITLGIDNQIAVSNAANTGAFDTDKSFLIIGDNGATVGTLTSVTPGGACSPPETVDKFTSRVWKSVETGSVESAKLSVDLSSYGFSTVNPVYMQVSLDAAFTSFANILMVKNGVNYETNYDFIGTQYIRFAGTTALPPANACSGDKTYEWNTFPSYWTWGQLSRTSTFGDTQFAVTITDPNGAIYAPSVYPVGQWWWNHIFIPRYDANGSSNKITTKIVMDKAANKASFEIFDIDEYFGKDVVNVYGKLGGVQVNPKITFPANSPLTVTTSGTGAKISATTGIWDISAYGKAFVNFTSAVDEIIIEYTKDNGWAFKSYQDIRIRNIDIQCKPFSPEVPLADNVYMSKQVVGGTTQKVDEAFTYKFTVTNLDCASKTINILDGLPSGLTFVDSTLSTSLVSASVNAYGGTSSLNMTGVVVPPGTSYIYVDAKGMTAGTFDNQADFTVGSNSYLSDDPAQVGASNPTPVTLVANRPLANLVITKTVDKATANQNEVIKYTYKVDNPNATAILTTFQDNLPATTAGGPFKYVAGTLTGIGSAIVTPTVYGGESSLTLRNLSIPASGSLTFTVDVNTSGFTVGQTGKNVASVTPDPSSTYRDIPYYSGQASTLIGACVAGTTAPTLSATSKANVCPATTTDLNSLVTSSCPVGSSLEWHNVSTGLSAANKVTNPVSVAGTYYPVCFDATGACYSPAPTTGVTVTITTCSGLTFTGGSISTGTVSQTATPSQPKSGDAATDLVPTGGTPGYTYSNGSSDPACVNPGGGALPLPASSNLNVTSTGAYTYTAPATPGTYFFCIKVCDSSTPTPVCSIATYKVTVATSCLVGSSIPVLKN